MSYAIAALILALLAASPGCARKADREVPGVPAGSRADSLPNGVPRALVAPLAEWIAHWGDVSPGFAPESLAHADSGPFQFDFSWPGANRVVDPVRRGAGIVVFSPDSSYALDFDSYLEFERNAEGKFELGREPDSAPRLADFARDTTWRVAFCGTPCFYDEGHWIDAERFALTGANRSGDDWNGPWQPFLEVYDLRSWWVSRWRGGPVPEVAFERLRAARDSALVERIEAASAIPGAEPAY